MMKYEYLIGYERDLIYEVYKQYKKDSKVIFKTSKPEYICIAGPMLNTIGLVVKSIDTDKMMSVILTSEGLKLMEEEFMK